MRNGTRFLAGYFVVLLALAGLVVLATRVEEALIPPRPLALGVTFVPSYARFLGTDWRESFRAMLDDLGVRRFRLTVPWDETEADRGQFTFGDIEWQLDELRERGGTAIVSIGRRTPRWPECHEPSWVRALPGREQDEATLMLLRATVERLRGREEIVAWQVENEPFLAVFGNCPLMSFPLYAREVSLVRGLDPSRPVITTESGELSPWYETAFFVDGIGISVYRQTWNRWLGEIVYPLPPSFYRRRAEGIRPFLKKGVFIISELQAEPWGRSDLTTLPVADGLALMDGKKLAANAAFAARTEASEAYFWGAEWWYALKTDGITDLWDAAKALFTAQRTLESTSRRFLPLR